MVRLEVEKELPGNSPGSAPRPASLEKEDSLSYQSRRRELTPKCHPLTSNASRDISIHTYFNLWGPLPLKHMAQSRPVNSIYTILLSSF